MKIVCSACGFEDEGIFCSNCGSRLPRKEGESDVTWRTILAAVVRILGIGEIIKIVASVHCPAVGISTAIARRPLPLVATLVAFGELVVLWPFLINFFLVPIMRAVDYPLFMYGKATEGLWGTVAVATASLLQSSVVWVLPGRMFLPNSKLEAVSKIGRSPLLPRIDGLQSACQAFMRPLPCHVHGRSPHMDVSRPLSRPRKRCENPRLVSLHERHCRRYCRVGLPNCIRYLVSHLHHAAQSGTKMAISHPTYGDYDRGRHYPYACACSDRIDKDGGEVSDLTLNQSLYFVSTTRPPTSPYPDQPESVGVIG